MKSEGIPLFTFHYDYFEEQYYEEEVYSGGDTAWIREYKESIDKAK